MSKQVLEPKTAVTLGETTLHGIVSAFGRISGERYVWTIDQHGTVEMFPEFVILEERDA